jgi:glycosyltransferase involved in cell wall biosynthesis
MVSSVRTSIAPPDTHGLSYEIVLVDGGSTDGTIEWCKAQPNIKLIEHGKLLGGVKAFNDGAYAATGKYVIMGNDDIEFVGDSIFIAYLYMELHPECGGGCFNQDRERTHMDWNDPNRWYVSDMPAVTKHKQQIHVPYAQVGIFHKWLGDQVGWWCKDDNFARNLTSADYRQINDGRIGLHTYGGDNELSACIIDLGYKISPIPGAKITDKEAEDDLRKINNIDGGHDPKSVRGHHPDSWKWGKRWFRRNAKLGFRDLAGPIIKDKIMLSNPNPPIKKERVLYLPLFEQGWAIQKAQKSGLRDALAKIATVIEYDYMQQFASIGKGRMMQELYDICDQFKPTIFLSQLHNADQINSGDLNNIKARCDSATKFANWNGDYWPKQLLREDGLDLARFFNLATVVNRDIVEEHQKRGINTQYWQIGWEPEGRGYEPEVYHDVVFLASGYSPSRQKLGHFLSDQNFNLGLYGSGWPEGMSKGENLYNFKEACKIYRGAKIAIGDSQWPDSGFVSNRIMQILAAGGCVLLHQWFRGMELLGLENGKNCGIWTHINELPGEISWYLNNEDERRKIAAAGEKLALDRHSFDSRVVELWEMLNVNNVENEIWRW